MKKTFKSALALFFVLVFVCQFAMVGAFADNAKEEPADDISVAIKVGGKDYSGTELTLAQLKGGVQFTPGKGAYVKSVSINGKGLTGYCIAEGRVLTIDGDTVDEIIADEVFDKEVKSFTVSAVAEKMEAGIKSITAPAAAEVEEGKQFECWVYKYGNGAVALVDAGETFTPFMSDVKCVRFISSDVEVEVEEEVTEPPMMRLGAPLLTGPAPDPVYVTIIPTGKVYDGQDVAVSGYNLPYTISVVKNDAPVSPEELAKYSLSGVELHFAEEERVVYPGSYPVKLDNKNNIAVSYGGEDISSRAYLMDELSNYVISARDVYIKAKAVTKVYDGSVLRGEVEASGLLDNHSVGGKIRFKGETSAICNKTYSIDKENSEIEIEDAYFTFYNIHVLEDAASYVITAPAEKDRTKITVKPVDVTRTFTGEEVEGDAKLTKGSIPEGAELKPVYEYSAVPVAPGSYKFFIKSVKVILDKEDISAAFDITIPEEQATLTISKCPLTVTVKNATKEYDGTALVANDYATDGLLSGHHVASVTYTGSQTNAGESASDISNVVIKDSTDHDVTGVYNITVVKGKLTVSKLKFTVEAKDAAKLYDGTALVAPNGYKPLSEADKAKLDKLGTWTLDVAVSGSRIEVGEGESKIVSLTLNVNGSPLNAINYEATLKPGKLEIQPDPLKPTVTLTVESKSKVYDGTPLILDPDAYTISDTIPGGYSIKVTLEEASQTSAGVKTVSVKEYKVYKGDVQLTNRADWPFNVALKTGTLTVTKFPITVTAKSGTKTYDGKEYVLNSATITAKDNKLANSNHKITITVQTQNGDGEKVQAIKVGKYYNVVTNVTIKDGNLDVTANYDITTVNGTLTVKSSNGNPKTGDDSNISLWATLLAVSAAAVVCAGTVIIRKKTH